MNQMEIIRRQIGAFSNILLLLVWLAVGNMVGDGGVAFLAVSLALCYLFTAIAGGGMQETLGRILRSRKNKGQYKNVVRIKQSAILFQLILGVAFALLLFGLSGVLAKYVMRVEYCALLICVLAPFVLLRTINGCLNGWLQGEGFELPASAVEILRPFLILGFSRLFVGKLVDYGAKVGRLLQDENFAAMYSGLGVVIAICVSELLCLIFLLILYKGCMMLGQKGTKEGLRTIDPFGTCVSALVSGGMPLSVAEFAGIFAILAGAFFWKRTAPSEKDFVEIYSAYMKDYWVVCGILIAVVFILSVNVLGKSFEYIRKEDKRFARITFQGGVHISMVHGIFFGVFTTVMAGQIVGILKTERADVVLSMLRMGAVVIVLGAVCCFYCRFLISAGRKLYVMGAVVPSAILVLVVNLVLFLVGKWSEMTFVYVGIVGLAVLWIILGSFAYRLMRVRMDWLRVLMVPLLAGAIVGGLCMLLGNVMTPHLGNGMTLFVTFLVATLIYWVILLLLRNFKEQELDVILGGKLMYALGQVLRVY